MRLKLEMNPKTIFFIAIIVVCILVLSYIIYNQIFGKKTEIENDVPDKTKVIQDVSFDNLFDNKINMQSNANANYINKIEPTKDLVYTTYTLNEIYEGKYEIQANIPVININHEKTININREITEIFYDKVNSIIQNARNEDAQKTIYTVTYAAYLNQNILSIAIKANLKEGDNVQRVIIQTYAYNISTNEEITLKDMLDIKGIEESSVESKIRSTVEEAINYSENMSSLGFETYKRDIKSSIYKVENSNNYFVGPNESIYIVYAYGNANFTSETDIIYIK